jgi:MFS family permease
VRRSPESIGLRVDGDEESRVAREPVVGDRSNRTVARKPAELSFTLGQALRHPAFWVLAISSAVFNLIFSGVSLFAESIVRERGFYAPETFRAAMATLAMGGLVANLVGGWLAGRVAPGRLMGASMMVVTAALVILPFSTGQGGVLAFAALMGIGGGVVTVVFFAVWATCFGRAHLGKIQGAAQGLTVLASAVGPVLLARGEQHNGSYSATFLIFAPVVAALAVGCVVVRLPKAVYKAPERDE